MLCGYREVKDRESGERQMGEGREERKKVGRMSTAWKGSDWREGRERKGDFYAEEDRKGKI